MAPKKRKDASVVASPSTIADQKDGESNRSIFEDFRNDLSAICQHPVFKNIVDAKPRGIGKSAKEGGGNQVASQASCMKEH